MEEKLIILVQGYKELYDQSSSHYYNQLRRQNIWEEIGLQLNLNGEECKKRWSQIRDNYRKALKARLTKSGQAAVKSKPIRFEKELEFMREFLGDRQQLSNIESPENVDDEEARSLNGDDDDSTETSLSPSPSPSLSKSSGKSAKRSRENTPQSALMEYLNYKKNNSLNKGDHLTKYFQSLEETVRTFQPRLQIEDKMKISALVHDLEVRNLSSQPAEYSYHMLNLS